MFWTPVRLSVHAWSVHLSFYPCVRLSLCPSVRMSVRPFVCSNIVDPKNSRTLLTTNTKFLRNFEKLQGLNVL